MATIKSLFRGIDGLVRSASVHTLSPEGQVTILNRPIQKLYPLEIQSSLEMDPSKAGDSSGTPVPVISQLPVDIVDSNSSPPTLRRPERRAAKEARSWIRGLVDD